jgi:hypothetical protein
MGNTYLRGALVEFRPAFGIPLPNVIIFQFNPESIAHAWTAAAAADAPASGGNANPLAVKGLPGESFTLSLAMDAGDMVADGTPVGAGIAEVSGIYTRLAALEMLQFPVPSDGGGLLGAVSASVGAAGASIGGAAGGAAPRPVPQNQVSTVLFVWGPGRILPVRVTSLSVTETLYDGLLNPTHATAALGLRVLTPDELKYVSGPLAPIAKGAYDYTQALREGLAVANLANGVESIIGMLPV